MRNKKGQLSSIIFFVIIVLTLLLMAPILIKIVATPLSKFSTSMTATDATNVSSNAITTIKDKFLGAFDWVIMFVFIFFTVLLFISSFLVDIHPAFVVVYIMAAFVLVIFAPTISETFQYFYEAPFSTLEDGSTISTHLPITKFIFDNFGMVILGIIVLSGLIMYGKYRFSASGQGTGATY